MRLIDTVKGSICDQQLEAGKEYVLKKELNPKTETIVVESRYPLKPAICQDVSGGDIRLAETEINLIDEECPQLYQGNQSDVYELFNYFVLPGYEDDNIRK